MLAVSFTLTTARDLAYLIAIAGFIFALKGLSSPRHARLGNLVGAAAATLAIAMTFTLPELAPLRVEPRAGPHRHGARRGHRRAGGALREDDRDATAGGHLQRRGRWGRRARSPSSSCCICTRSDSSPPSTSRPRSCWVCSSGRCRSPGAPSPSSSCKSSSPGAPSPTRASRSSTRWSVRPSGSW